jgi:acetylornithine deacetylase/succinyl-diaminopimelate desuccinylase-like protein
LATANGMAREAMGYLDGHINDWKQVLVDLCRIPSMSASGFPAEQVRRSAQAVAKALTDAGVENVQVLTIPGVHPYVYGDWLHRPGAPTVLLSRKTRGCCRAWRSGARRSSPRWSGCGRGRPSP